MYLHNRIFLYDNVNMSDLLSSSAIKYDLLINGADLLYSFGLFFSSHPCEASLILFIPNRLLI